MRTGESPSFGALLRRFRIDARVSQEALAERAGISVQAVGALERGNRRAPYRATVDLLVAALPLTQQQGQDLLTAAAFARGERVRAGMSAPRAEVQSPASNLPFEVSSLIGRADEIAAISTLLDANRLITLTGPGGVGKTRVALRVAADQQGRLKDGAWFVDLSALADPNLVAETAAAALGLRAPGESPLDLLVRYLHNQQMLIVLDNCEHLVAPAAAFAAEILKRCSGVRLLTTSREALAITGEITCAIPPLQVPDSNNLEGAETYPAIALFCERARERDARFRLDSENLAAVREVVRGLDGIPLAIELAAARAGVIGASALARRLDERFQLLVGGDRTRGDRQQTLRSLIAWSHDLLSTQEKQLFYGLSIFAGGWTIEALEDIIPAGDCETTAILGSLVDKSLVATQPEGGSFRYRLLESTQVFAFHELKAGGAFDRLSERHAAWVANFLAASERSSGTTSLDLRLRAVRPELPNIRVALERCAASGDFESLGEIAARLPNLYYWIGLSGEARKWTKVALEHIDEALLPRLAARLWIGLARVATEARARLQASQRAIELATQIGDDEILAAALDRLAISSYVAGRLEESLSANTRALDLHGGAEGTESLHVAWSLVHRSWILVELGRLAEARNCLADASGIFSDLRAGREAWMAHCDLAELEFAAGDARRALEVVDEAIPEARRLKDSERELVYSCNRAGYLVCLGRFDEAEATARDALRMAGEAEDGEKKLHALEHLASTLACRGEATRACTLLGFVQAAYERLGYQRETTERSSYEIGREALRGSLDAATIDRLLSEGKALRESRAMALALRRDEPISPTVSAS